MTGRGLNKNPEAIREMIDHRLKSLSKAETVNLPAASHLDEDTISAFVEGRLGTTESKPVLSHLTVCDVCRRASAQLVRLEDEVATGAVAQTSADEPGRLRAFLSNLSSMVPATGEEVVFAYQNPDAAEQSEASAESEDDKKTKPLS